MRSLRFGLLLFLLSLCLSVWAQQTANQQQASAASGGQDPQAVGVLNQSLAAAGGATAIRAITDYTATGNVSYHWNPEEEGTVAIQGLGVTGIRIDAYLPSGVRSQAIHEGQTSIKGPQGNLWQYPPSYSIPSSEAFPYQPPLFPSGLVMPYLPLALVLNNARYSISYLGVVQVDGQSVHDIQVQRILANPTKPDSMAWYHRIDFFITVDTLQIVMTQDNVPNNVVHQVRFSNYKQLGGILVPFAISERMGGQNTNDFQLSQVNFNLGLQDSAFVIQ
jgi:hypothetical protein